MMNAEERAEVENLQHRHLMLLEEHRQLQRECEDMRRRYANMLQERVRRGDYGPGLTL